MLRRALVVAAVLVGPIATANAAPCDSANVLADKTPARSAEVSGDASLLTDGAVGPEGAQWNAPVGVTMQTPTASITYDLGEPRALSAFYMQGDANDTYTISGSLDGAEGSFHVVGTFPNVIAVGHGLRQRTSESAPTTLRYLRVTPGEGDGYFSITELAAFCQKPSPFPPFMKGSTVSSGDAAPVTVQPAWASFLALYGFGLLVLVLAAVQLRGHRD